MPAPVQDFRLKQNPGVQAHVLPHAGVVTEAAPDKQVRRGLISISYSQFAGPSCRFFPDGGNYALYTLIRRALAVTGQTSIARRSRTA